MHPPVGGIRRRSHRCGVGDPHRGRARAKTDELRIFPRGARQHGFVATVKTEPSKRRQAGAWLRGQKRLGHAEVAHETHLRQSLTRSGARIGWVAAVLFARHVAGALPTEVVAWPDEPVDAEPAGHRALPVPPATFGPARTPPPRSASASAAAPYGSIRRCSSRAERVAVGLAAERSDLVADASGLLELEVLGGR